MGKLSLEQIGVSILHDSDYHGFCTFFKDIWASKHEYVVIFARRCYALNNVFLRIFFEEKERQEKAERIISQNALLLYADEFANHYRKFGVFPGVLLVDDVMLHGRGVAKLLYDFENLICQELKKSWDHADFTENDRYYVHQRLIAAVDISIYAMNKAPALMDSSFMRRIKYATQQRSNELKDLSLRISTYLQKANEPNTSYRYSFPVPTVRLLSVVRNWHRVSWQYRGKKYDVFFKQCDDLGHFYPMVYTHGVEYIKDVKNTSALEEYTWVTGVAVGGDVSREDFDTVCADVIKVLQKEVCQDKKNPGKFDFLIKILQSDHDLQQRQKVQLMSFFLSAVYVYDFCNEYGINVDMTYKKIVHDSSDIEKNILFDMHKIVTNFGKRADVNDGIWALFDENSNLIQLLREPLLKFQSITSQISRDVINESSTANSSNVYNRLVEDIFYRLGTDSEYEAYEISANNRRFVPSSHNGSPDVISLCKCLSEAEEVVGQLDIYSILACVTILVDCGLAAMNFAYNPVSKKIQCMFKAGELSTFTVPRRYHWFIPALALIEKEYYAKDDRRAILSEFIEQLSLEVSQTSNGYTADENEQKAFSELKANGNQFIDRIYRCGQIINDWNINLLTMDDWMDSNSEQTGSYLDFLMRNNARRNVYIAKAKAFLQKKWSGRFA